MKFDFDFLKDRYDYELKRKDQITAALTLPVGVLIALGTVMAAMARSFSYRDGYLTWCFLIFLLLAAVAFLLCVVFLGLAYHRQTYWYLPQLSELQKIREKWRGGGYIKAASYDEHEKELVIKEGEDLFQRVLEMRIIGAADENTKNNDMRGDRYLYRARVAIFVVLGLTAITGVTYVLDQVRY